MGYNDNDEMAHKTGRIAILAILIFALGGLFFAYKVNACAEKPQACQDQFYEIKNDQQNTHACAPGAIAEVVNSPPAPKPGILCHCAPTGPASGSPIQPK